MAIPKTLTGPGLLAAAIVLLTAAVLVGLRWVPFIVVIEKWLDDVRIAVLTPIQPPNDDIVIVAITEDTLAKFPYRSPVDRGFLADVVAQLAGAEVRALGIDILFDQPTEPAKDAKLRAELTRFPAPLVVTWGDSRAGITATQAAFMDAYLAGLRKGFANLIKDRDGIVRSMFRGAPVDGGYRYGLPLEIAGALGLPLPAENRRIAYSGRTKTGASPFKRFPAHAVPLLPKAWFTGKIVLIGAVLPQEDRHLTPLSSAFGAGRGALAGIEIHAHALAQLIDRRSLTEPGWPAVAAMVAVLIAFGLAVSIARWPVATKLTANLAALTALWGGAGYLYVGFGVLIPLFAPTLGLLAAGGLGTGYLARRHNREKRFIRNAFSRFLSPSVVSQLERNPGLLALGGERRPLSLIFTDVADFTTLSESTAPNLLVPALNDYLDGICRIVIRHEGTIDKFIGDAVVAFFNAPVAQPDHARRAVVCALEMNAFATEFAARQRARGVAFGLTRIGVHTGTVTVGNFGGESRFDYTAIGDAMNTAARLESVNKHLGTTICVSGATAGQCPDIPFRPVGELVLKGKTEGVEVFEPLGEERQASPAIRQYLAAFALLRTDGLGARDAFAKLVADAPDDPLARLHLERLENGERGVRIVMAEK